MGKIFLLAIVAGMIYAGMGLYGQISTIGQVYKPDEQIAQESPRELPPKTLTEAREPAQAKLPEPEKPEPLPVVASSTDFVQVEAWGIVQAGGELPDGSVLRSWTHSEAIVRTPSGKHERQRFRRPQEVLALLIPVATSVANPGSLASMPTSEPGHSNDHLKVN